MDELTTMEGYEYLRRLQKRRITGLRHSDHCGLCNPDKLRYVCSNCVTIIMGMDQDARSFLYDKLEPEQQRLFDRCFAPRSKIRKESVITHKQPETKQEAAELRGTPKRTINLRALRLRKGLTQAKLGRILGRSQSFIAQIENGSRPLPRELLSQVRIATNISED